MVRGDKEGGKSIMIDYSQQLEKEIMKKNMLLNSFNQNYDSDKENAQNVQAELDGLLYQYFKQLRFKEE